MSKMSKDVTMHKVFPRKTRASRRLYLELIAMRVHCMNVALILWGQHYGTLFQMIL